jgi:Beta-lactamase class C and other penicillin binding proteins
MLSQTNTFQFIKRNVRFLIFILLIQTTGCKNGSTEKWTENDRAMIDTIVARKYRSVPVPGMAVGIVVGDQIYTRTKGYSDASTFAPFTDSTIFCSGIISETFTASLALALQDRFKIDLDEPVSKYLSYFALQSNTYQTITLKHLLTQSSGVPRHGVVWDFPDMGDSALYATTWSIRMQEPEFNQPGTRVVRSPYNFDIAADFISHASKMRFERFASDFMLDPLDMKHSTYDPKVIFGSAYARSYQIGDWLTYRFTPRKDYPVNGEHAGSIGLNTTIEDITHWMSMLLNNGMYKGKQVFASNLVKQMMTPVFRTDQKDSYMGLGWEIKTVNGVQLFFKSGEVGGFDHALLLIPEFRMGVIVAINAKSDFQPAVFAQELLFSIKNKTIPQYKPSIHVEMGRILHSTGSVDQSIAFFNKELQNKSSVYDCSDMALSQFGSNLLYRLQRQSDALKVYQACLSTFPKSPYSHLNLAEYYLTQKDVKKTEMELNTIQKLPKAGSDVVSRVKMIKGTLALIKEKQSEKE